MPRPLQKRIAWNAVGSNKCTRPSAFARTTTWPGKPPGTSASVVRAAAGVDSRKPVVSPMKTARRRGSAMVSPTPAGFASIRASVSKLSNRREPKTQLRTPRSISNELTC